VPTVPAPATEEEAWKHLQEMFPGSDGHAFYGWGRNAFDNSYKGKTPLEVHVRDHSDNSEDWGHDHVEQVGSATGEPVGLHGDTDRADEGPGGTVLDRG
jgi:hypothetical protein